MTLNLKNDWQKIVFRENISYSSRIDDQSYTPPFTITALKTEIKKTYDEFGSVETSQIRANFHVWETSTTEVLVPKRGDYFIRSSDSSEWHVEKVADYDSVTGKYRLECYQLIDPVDKHGFLLLQDGIGGVIL